MTLSGMGLGLSLAAGVTLICSPHAGFADTSNFAVAGVLDSGGGAAEGGGYKHAGSCGLIAGSSSGGVYVNLGGFEAVADAPAPVSPETVVALLSAGGAPAITSDGYTANGKTLALTLTFAPTPGAVLTVIENTGLGFITGGFSNLAQGQIVTLAYAGNAYRFAANYYGGSGNDLELVWADQRLVGWGNLNPPSLTKSPVPVNPGIEMAGKPILAFAAANHALALATDGTLTAWGDNSYGQIGNGVMGTGSSLHTDPVAIQNAGVLAGRRVIAVSAGQWNSLALCSDGTLAAWGFNGAGQLGDNSTANSALPVAVDRTGALAGKQIVAIATGAFHSLALASDGEVYSWGDNSNGQLGVSGVANSLVPIPVDASETLAGKTVIAISAGTMHSLALCSDGTVAAWGYNWRGQVGDGTSGNFRSTPTAVIATGVLAGKTVTAIAAGQDHSLALCSDGTVAAWGENFEGELGTNNGLTISATPVLVVTKPPSALYHKSVADIDAGNYSNLALCSDGSLTAWGWNHSGELGINSTQQKNYPVAVSRTGLAASERFMAVCSGAAVSYAIVAGLPSEIAVEQPAGNGLNDGAPVNFGAVTIGAGKTLSFVIRNLGAEPLTGLTIFADGDSAGDFSIGNIANTPLLPSQSRTFTVKFQPTAPDARTAALHILSNDEDESPFDLVLTGIGYAKPSIVTAPVSPGLIDAGSSLTLSAVAGGSGPLTYQWLHNNLPIPGANDPACTINAVSLKHAGTYAVKVSNNAGTVTSTAVAAWIIDRAGGALDVNEDARLALAARVAGPGLSYAWSHDDTPVMETGTGYNTANLVIAKARQAHSGIYVCHVSGGFGTAVTGAFAVTVHLKPVLENPGSQAVVVSETFSLQLAAANEPVRYAVTGLPAGLSIDATTGLLSGKATKAGFFAIKATATNSAGTSLPVTFTLSVFPLPAGLVGSFYGLINRSTELSLDSTHTLSGHGGSLKILTTSLGTFSGTLRLEAKTHAFTGKLDTGLAGEATAYVVIPRGPDAPALSLSLAFNSASGGIAGAISDGGASMPVDVEAWRNPWSKLDPAVGISGAYNAALDVQPGLAGDPAVPQGSGYGSLTLSLDGTARWAGRMADGTTVTASSAIGASGRIPLFALLYTPTTPATAGSALGWITATESGGGNQLDGILTWMKLPQSPTNKTRLYHDGFPLHDLTVIGCTYAAPPAGSIVLNLPAAADNATIVFSDGGPSDQSLTITSSNTAVLPGSNPFQLRLPTLDAATGLFSGTFVLPGATAAQNRAGSFYGMFVPRLGKGAGYFLVAKEPVAPQTTATSPQVSGQVLIEGAP